MPAALITGAWLPPAPGRPAPEKYDGFCDSWTITHVQETCKATTGSTALRRGEEDVSGVKSQTQQYSLPAWPQESEENNAAGQRGPLQGLCIFNQRTNSSRFLLKLSLILCGAVGTEMTSRSQATWWQLNWLSALDCQIKSLQVNYYNGVT